MKAIKIIICITAIASAGLLQAQEVKLTEVKTIMEKVADWQIEHINDLYSGREKPHNPLGWQKSTWFVGMVK
jgi:unsaturated rhamnogalacturonyl hydrolase